MRVGLAVTLLLAFAARGQVPSELERAIALEQSGQADKAIALLQSILKRDPRLAEAHNWLGVAFLQKNSLTEAEREFREAIRLKPGFVRAYNNLGSTLAQGGDIEQGIRVLNDGLKFAPGDLQLRINLGMALRSRGDAEGAIRHFRSLLQEHGDSPELHYQYGQTLRQQGDLQGAVGEFETTLTLDPQSQEAYYALGQTLKQVSHPARRRSADEAAGFLKAGAEALSRNDFSAARVEAEKAIAAEPDSAHAYHLLGYALWYSGDYVKAAAALDESLRLNPLAADVCSFRGMTYRESGDLNQARRMLQRAIALDPQLPLPYIDLGVVLLLQGKLESAVAQFDAGLNLPASQSGLPDLDTAIRELRRAIEAKPKSGEGYAVLGRLLGAAGASPPDVIAAFAKALALRPDDAETRNALGLVYVQSGDDEKASTEFRQAIRLRPDYADAHQNLGAVLTTSDPAEAVRELETAVRLQPRLLKAQYNLALAYEASPRHGPSKALEAIRGVIAAEPRYPRAEFILGRLLLRQGNVEQALEHLRKSVALEPEYGEARYQLGLALSRSGRNEEGAAEIRKSRDLITAKENRQAAALDLAEAKAALMKGDVAAAEAKARKVLAFDPGSTEASFVLRSARPNTRPPANTDEIERNIREGRFAEAIALLRKLLENEPNSAWAWYALGYSFYGERKIGDSIQALAKSLELDRTNAEAHKVLGRDLMIIGRFDAAKLEFEQGKRLNPKSAELPYNLGKLFSIQDNWADARREFEAAIQLDPEYMEAYDGLGFALEALGEDAAAVVSYRKAIALSEARHTTFASPFVNLSALSNRKGDSEAALEYARKALLANPNSDRALFQLAKAQEYRGDLNAAAEALNRAVAINGRASSYYYVLATVNRKLGKMEESRKAMEMFVKLDRESNDLEQKRREFLKDERRDGNPQE